MAQYLTKASIGPDTKPDYNYALQNQDMPGGMEPDVEPDDILTPAKQVLKKVGIKAGKYLGGLAAGQIFYDPQFKKLTNDTLNRLAFKYSDFLKRTPTQIHIGGLSRRSQDDAILHGQNPETFAQAVSSKALYDQGLRQKAATIQLGNKADTYTLGHEGIHTALGAAGEQGKQIPGTNPTQHYIAHLMRSGYRPDEIPEENAADFLSGRGVLFHKSITDITDWHKMNNYLKSTFHPQEDFGYKPVLEQLATKDINFNNFPELYKRLH